MHAQSERPVLLVGGSGVVGSQVAQLLRRSQPDLPIIIAGRNQDAARREAASLGNAEALDLDVGAPALPEGCDPALIVALANDPANQLLGYAIRNGIAYLDITRWTERLRTALVHAAALAPLRAPVVFASSWMAGVSATLARELAADLSQVDRIDIDILYATADKAGPDSAAYMDRLSIPFEVTEQGKPGICQPFSDARGVNFGAAKPYRVYRFDAPDQVTLPMLTGAASVATRIGFDDRNATALLRFMVRSKLWSLIAGSRFTGLRRAILYNPGKGAAHRIRITAAGRNQKGEPEIRTLLLTDPAGQTHLTAMGTTLLIERILGLGALNALDLPPAGIALGEALLDPVQLRRRLLAEGVGLEE